MISLPMYILFMYHTIFLEIYSCANMYSVFIKIGLLSDTMVRQAAMILKCIVLMHYKNGRGHNFRRQVTLYAIYYIMRSLACEI